MEHFELRVLADYLQPGVQAANTWARPTPAAVGGELEQDERGEVVFAEIWPPLDAVGPNDEDLRKVIILLDGENTGKYISLSGIRTNLMVPPKERIFSGHLYSFGTPGSNNPLESTTLKYKQNVTVACLAGPNPAGITGAVAPYRVRLWGKVYKADEIPQVFGMMQFPAILRDKARQRILTLDKSPTDPLKVRPVDKDSWLTLPGGKDQAIPKINPFARYAYNLLATDGMQGDYQFRLTTGGVFDEEENLYFEFDQKEALFIQGLGVAAANDLATLGTLARTGLRIAGDYHPRGPTDRAHMFPTDIGINPLNYGLFPVVMAGVWAIPPMDIYVAIPKLDRPYLIWNETGYVVVRDDGTAPVAANTVVVAVTGIRIEMRS